MRWSWDVDDPSIVAESLELLSVIYTGQAVDAFWPFLVTTTVEEMESLRRRQLIRLARYGRQSLFVWDDVEVVEIEAWVHELIEVLRAESGSLRPED